VVNRYSTVANRYSTVSTVANCYYGQPLHYRVPNRVVPVLIVNKSHSVLNFKMTSFFGNTLNKQVTLLINNVFSIIF